MDQHFMVENSKDTNNFKDNYNYLAFKVTLTIKHNCELFKLRKDLGMNFRVLCSEYSDLFIFQKKLENKQIKTILDFIGNDDSYISSIENNQSFFLFTCKLGSKDHLMHFYSRLFQNLGIMFDWPIITDNGEIYGYHCLDNKSHSDVLEDLQRNLEIKIDSIKEYNADEYFGNAVFSIGDLVNKLTPLQANILVDAYQKGYYKVPREIRTEDLAKELKRKRYSVDKLIRTAENKVMHFIYPYLWRG